MFYPIHSTFSHNFLEASEDYYFHPMKVYDADGELVDPANVPKVLEDTVVQLDFEISASVYSGMIGKIVAIAVL